MRAEPRTDGDSLRRDDQTRPCTDSGGEPVRVQDRSTSASFRRPRSQYSEYVLELVLCLLLVVGTRGFSNRTFTR